MCPLLLPAMLPCWGNRKEAISVNKQASYDFNVRHSLFIKRMSVSHFSHLLFLHYSKPPQVSGKQFLKIRQCFLKEYFVSTIFFRCNTPKQAWKQGGGNPALVTAGGPRWEESSHALSQLKLVFAPCRNTILVRVGCLFGELAKRFLPISCLEDYIFYCTAVSSFSFFNFWPVGKNLTGNALPLESSWECAGNPLIDRLQPTEAIGQELVATHPHTHTRRNKNSPC